MKKMTKYFVIPSLLGIVTTTIWFLKPKSGFAENSIDKSILTINMADVASIPWDNDVSGVHTVETFSAAVHGSLVDVAFLGSTNNTNQNILFENTQCEDTKCIAKLKKGVYFHNGREVNAYDVEFSFTRPLIYLEGSNFAQTILDDIVGVNDAKKENIVYEKIDNINYPSKGILGLKVIDKYNIQFELKRYNKRFFERISDGRLPIVPIEEFNETFTNWKLYPVGFGKYKVTKADFKKHEYFLQKASAEEKIPSYIKLIFGNENGGDIKMLLGGPERGVSENEHVIIFSNIYSNAGFLYNFQTPLGRNENFRKAISLALDRYKIAEHSTFREMQAEDQMLPNSGWQKEYRADFPIQKQNIAEAKKLLKKVPAHLWKNKVFEVPTYWEDAKEIYSLPYISEIQRQLKEVGINVIFLNTDMNYDKFKKDDKNVLFFTGFGFANRDPNRNFRHFLKGSYFTYEQPNDPQLKTLYEIASREVNTNPDHTKKLSTYFHSKNYMTIILNQRMSLSYDNRKIISFGNQHNGIRLALWQIKVKEE
ncbi:ABC transporter substrate-binding protein [Pigmentibacter ruber]|uniref:ABC transporter substrate-binding protein n=1 Tax=Pigmentibacter ruber TaxID=2683196 RepID=UPI00131DD912|nr:ABC transporter substrate-binding protein [Pigmentibacter ruber]